MSEPINDECGCTCVPQVFSRVHRDDLLVAWFWPDGDMWLQQNDCVPIQVTSDRFATQVELDWTPVEVEPGALGVWVTAPTGPAYFDLIR